MTPDPDLPAFLALSRALTGVDELDPSLAGELLARIRAASEAARLPDLLARFGAILAGGGDPTAGIDAGIMAAAELAPLARQITLLWYTSAFESAGRWTFGTPRQYFGALLWPIIGAHPPALSGGYFGYWKYPPEL